MLVPWITLETPRLVLRPPGDHDVSLLCAAFRSNAGRLHRRGDETLTRTATWITGERDGWEHGDRHSFLALDKTANRPTLLGHVSLFDVLRGARQSASVGFWVDRSVEGQGVAFEALRAVLDWAFRVLDLHRLEAAVLPENLRSQRLLGRLGFALEGRARGYLAIADQFHDHLLFARLQDDPEQPPG